MKKKIVIIVDNPLRDLPACTLIAAELSKNNYVWLVPMSQAAFEIFRISPDLVLLNYLRKTNLSLVWKLFRAEIPYSILDTEGGVFLQINSSETSYTKTLIENKKIRYGISQYFVWGTQLFNYLADNNIYPKKSLLCLGTPRTDFYHESFRTYFDRPSPNEPPMILINTSFPTINPKFSTQKKEIEMLISKFGYERVFIEKLMTDLESVMQHYISLTEFLAVQLPDVQFVLRPHPFENLNPYIQKLKNYKNITVSCDGAVSDWIWKCRALIHYECSTAIEAALAAKPNFSLSEYRNLRPIKFLQNITDYCDSPTVILDKLKVVLSGRYQIPENCTSSLNSIESEVYFKVDGKSYLRISLEIEHWLSSSLKKRSIGGHLAANYFKSFFTFRTLIKFLFKKNLNPEGKKFSTQQVNAILAKLSPIINNHLECSLLNLSTAIKIIQKK